MSWSADQYAIFENERTRPVRDLLAAVPGREPASAVDIGCGPGNSTQVLAAQFPGAAVCGLDSSTDMVAAARKRLPRMQFDLADVETWDAPGPYGVILANAVLQWVPGHATLLPRLVQKLAAGGSLAVQMPDNLDEPAHNAMREVAGDARWAQRLAGATRMQRFDARWYFDLLRAHCRHVDVWRTVYHHPLASGAAGVVEWFKGSALRPLLDRLTPGEQALFLERYTEAVAAAHPAMADGTVLLPFPRLFIVATR